MTETPATSAPGAPVFPPGRYGRRREPRRQRPWLLAVLVALVMTAGGMVAWRLYGQYGDPTYDAKVVRYAVTDSRVLIEFRVNVPAGGSAVCVLRAKSRDGAEVGKAEVRVTAPAGETSAVATHELPTRARAVGGEVLRCRAAQQ